ncbi:hypothetical protein HMPREF0645_1372 [Hallella bergensis DSM 17361]|uniref:Uncharacterized protein n=1 Tax=Hallella bergensis DSM 17361 TaxID=585502 RepID=D1PWN7_9BACT|nr:hypothetical protein HMPREF0645_1372 [Hallella bergensis DSM 17361]
MFQNWGRKGLKKVFSMETGYPVSAENTWRSMSTLGLESYFDI